MTSVLLRNTAKHLMTTIAAVIIVAVAAAGYYGVARLDGNFHTTIPGELYRSAQLNPAQLVSYHATYGIKTIVNLRGEHDGQGWYDKEVAESARLGINHLNFPMSSRKQLSQEEAEALLSMLKKAQKPILIHCEGGADRSGLAAALYVAAIAHGTEAQAEAQMSIEYGHISLSVNPAFAMDRTFEALEPWLGFPNS
ncbi:Tyrosine phosphatase family protein [Phyllobacterium sp. YR620]|nr:Tyrosine phosphatase family protein [Phyllobacterium sp. YR620]